MIAPKRPFGCAIGEAVLDDQPDGQFNDPASVMAAAVSEFGGVGVEVLAAGATVVLRAEQNDVARPAGEGVAKVVESAADDAITVGAVAAPRAGSPPIVAATDARPGFGQVFGT